MLRETTICCYKMLEEVLVYDIWDLINGLGGLMGLILGLGFGKGR